MKKLSFIVLSLLLIQLPQINVNAATLKQGTSCKKVGQILRSGKNIFICEAALNGKVLIKQQVLSKNSKSLALDAQSIISKLSSLDTTRISNFINSEVYLKEQLNALEVRLSEIPILITTSKNTKVQLESDVTALPARINQSKLIMEQSKSALTLPEQNYLSLNSQLNSMSYEYDYAQRERAANLTCSVLKTFGLLGSDCGPSNPGLEMIIIRYNSLKIQVDSAKAIYNNYSSTYNAHLQQYNNLASSQLQLTSKVFEEQRKITELSQELNAKNLELKKSQSEIAILSKVKNNEAFSLDVPNKLSESINFVISESSKTWSKQLNLLFRKSSLLQYDFGLIPIIQPASSPTSTAPTPSSTSAPTSANASGVSYTAFLDKATYAPGEIATLLITGKDVSGNLVPDGTQLASSQEIITTSFSPNSYAVAPKFTDTSRGGRWTYRLIIGSAPGTYSGTFKIGNMAEQKTPYVVRNGG
jgi:hypothetical protein